MCRAAPANKHGTRTRKHLKLPVSSLPYTALRPVSGYATHRERSTGRTAADVNDELQEFEQRTGTGGYGDSRQRQLAKNVFAIVLTIFSGCFGQ